MLARAQWKPYVLRVRGKMDTYNNNTRYKVRATSDPLRPSPTLL